MGKDAARDARSKLYKMNKQSFATKEKYPHTKNWIFVPFRADGSITNKHIAHMIREQNLYLRDEISISITGLKDISSTISTPGTGTKLLSTDGCFI